MGAAFRHVKCFRWLIFIILLNLYFTINVDEDQPKTRLVEEVKNMVAICCSHS